LINGAPENATDPDEALNGTDFLSRVAKMQQCNMIVPGTGDARTPRLPKLKRASVPAYP